MRWREKKENNKENKVSNQQDQKGSQGKRSRFSWNQPTVRGFLAILVAVVTIVGVVATVDGRAVYATALAQGGQPNAGTLAIVGASGAQLYDKPGGEAIQQLAAGTVLTAVGRSADNLWAVVHNDADLAGWVEASEVVLFGIEQLPVMVEGNVPVAEPGATAQPGNATQAPALMPTPTATPLATATFTPSPIPTATSTPSPTPSPTPLPPTATSAPASAETSNGNSANSLVAIVRGGGAGLYDKPGGTQTQQLSTGTALTAWGRSADGLWLVVVASSGGAGWVQLADVVVFNIESLPVLDEKGALPSGGDASTATSSPAEGGSDGATAAADSTPEAAQSGDSVTPSATVAADDDTITASVAVTDSRLNIRSGPGTSYSIVVKADPGDVFEVSGRNAEATWIEVLLPDTDDGFGWVSAEFVTLSRPVLGIPISERASEAPTIANDPPASDAVAATTSVSQPSSAPTDLSGRLVFQSTNGGTIYVYDLASGALAELSGGFDPAISPDGKTVAFTRSGGDQGLYLIDINGQNERRIWNGGEGLRGPTWSPDGKWIAFVRQSGAFQCRDVGFGICLPDNPFLGDFPLASIPEFNLSRVDFNGENFRDIPALNTAQAPNWASEEIVYQASTGLEITKDIDEVTTRPLVQAPYYQDPNWQPNGNRILFQSREGSHWGVFAINSDGGGQSALTRPATALVENLPSNVAPAWSPDGKMIVFLSNRDEKNNAGDWRLWVMNADGSNQHPLPIEVPLEYTFGNEQVVSWGVNG